ncbi:MAG: hypothetical protein KatS3mg112_1671 [Thermogutta sp.]|nr:MAG: hypothetical protein KatS3mg112_1671 [Thermogutta sp.]
MTQVFDRLHPKPYGLYDPQYEHDACGIGAVVNISGRRDHQIIEYGKQVLLNLMHRGASVADEVTGDGAGILFQIPHEFFEEELARDDVALPPPRHYGVAVVFFPREDEIRIRCEAILEAEIARAGLKLLGRREVPSDNSCLGDIARACEPRIFQFFIDGVGLVEEELERRLFVTRKKLEHRVRRELGDAAVDFYIPSMSCYTIVYKGMFLAPQLAAYYPDLSDPRVVSALAIVHQRYSTNTFPSWKLAQPFRMIAHNGEINTLRGNINHLAAYEKTDVVAAFRGRHQGDLSDHRAGCERLCGIRQLHGVTCAWWAVGAPRPHDDDSGGLWAEVSHQHGQTGVL